MKKTIYIIVIAVITCICMIIGIFSHMFNVFKFNGASGISVSEENDLESFTELQLNMNVVDLKIVTGEKFAYSYNGMDNLEPTINVENGKLIVKQDVKGNNHKLECDFVLVVPEGTELDKIDVMVNAGDLKFEGISAKEFKVKANAGDLDFKNCLSENADINADAGNLDLIGCDFKSGKVQAAAGDIKVDNIKFENLEVLVNMGDIDVSLPDKLEMYTINASVDLGGLEVNNKDYKKSYSSEGNNNLTVKCDLGDINLVTK